MLRSVVAVVVVLGLSCSTTVQNPAIVGGRDFSKAPYLAVSTADTSGHGCAIRDDLFVTAHHIAHPEGKARAIHIMWSTANNAQWGQGLVLGAGHGQDIVMVRVVGQKFKRWFPVGKPIQHQQHYWWEYTFDEDEPQNTFRRKLRGAKWLREFAGNIVLDKPASQGASGSCLFNAQGQAVGILVKSSIKLSSSVAVRFQFSQKDVDALPRVE